MSRKRGKNKPVAAVPEEILAEGSGPNEVVEVDAQSLADAAAGSLIEGGVAVDHAEAAAARDEQSVEDAMMRAEAEAELGQGEEPGGDADEVEELSAAMPTTAASMGEAQLKSLVEALVFAADKPVTMQRLRQLTRVSDVKRLEMALAALASDYTERGIVLQQVSGGYQFRTNTQFSVWVQQLIAGRPVRLSRAQLETLAIVAYRQPITRPEVDEIRGVDSSATLRLLLDRSLIRILGKKEEVGRPMLYGTTKEFLDFFSLGDLRELPTLREYSELTAESRQVVSDRLGADAGVVPDDGSALADPPAEGEAFADAEMRAGVDVEADQHGDSDADLRGELDANLHASADAGLRGDPDVPDTDAEAGPADLDVERYTIDAKLEGHPPGEEAPGGGTTLDPEQVDLEMLDASAPETLDAADEPPAD